MLLQSLINLKCHYFSRGEIIIFFFLCKTNSYSNRPFPRWRQFTPCLPSAPPHPLPLPPSSPLHPLLFLLLPFPLFHLRLLLFPYSTPSPPLLPLPPPSSPPFPSSNSMESICFFFFFLAGLRAVAHLWQEFVLEMRYRWENDIFIPRYCGKKFSAPSEVTYNLGEITVLELLSLHRVSSYKQGI